MSNNQLENIPSAEGIIVGISEVKEKTYGRGRYATTYYNRYIGLEVPLQGRIVVSVQDKDFNELPRNKDGQTATLRNGDLVIFDNLGKTFQLQDGRPMATNPKIITVLGHHKEESFQTYTLNQIEFYDWGVQLRNKNSVCCIPSELWNSLTGIQTSGILNRIKNKIKEDLKTQAYIQLKTTFNVSYFWDLNKPFYSHNNGEPVIITTDNLQEIKKVITEEAEVTRMRLIMEEIKLKLQNQMFLTTEDITALVRKYTIPEDEVMQYAKNIVWKKDYDEEYTNWLHSKAKNTLYGFEGLFYLINKITVLEDPTPNRATYIFIGDPNFIASNIEAIRREAGTNGWREVLYRLKKSDPTKFNWFVGRVPHYDKQQWTSDMESILKAAETESITMKFPDDPKHTNTSVTANLVTKTEAQKPSDKYSIEVHYCPSCKIEVRAHVKLNPDGHDIDDHQVLKVFTPNNEEATPTRFCPDCGNKHIHFEKAYQANKKGEITE